MKRALMCGLLLITGAAIGAPPQPTAEIGDSAQARFSRVSQLPGFTAPQLQDNMESYFGQYFEYRTEIGTGRRKDWYLVRRDPKTNEITFMRYVGSTNGD